MNTVDYTANFAPRVSTVVIGVGSGSVTIQLTGGGTTRIWFNITNLRWEFDNGTGSYPMTLSFGGAPGTLVAGTTSSPGTATTISRWDHVHSHGALAGGSAHAVATGSVPGFVSTTVATTLSTYLPHTWGDRYTKGVISEITATNCFVLNLRSAVSLNIVTSGTPKALVHGVYSNSDRPPSASDWTIVGSYPGTITDALDDCWGVYGSGLWYQGANDGATQTLRGRGVAWAGTQSIEASFEPIPNALGTTGGSYIALIVHDKVSNRAVTVGIYIDHGGFTSRILYAVWSNATTRSTTISAAVAPGVGGFFFMITLSDPILSYYSIDRQNYWQIGSVAKATAFPSGYGDPNTYVGIGGYGYNVVNRAIVKHWIGNR